MVFDKNKKIEEKIELINARIRDFPEFVDELEVYTRTLDVENLESHDINDVDDLIAERSQGLATKCVATWLEAESRIAENNAPETARVHRKKKMTLHTSHGNIVVVEMRYLHNNKVLRPLSLHCSLSSKMYTRRLQRLITDFGADAPFHQISQKMQEHHGFFVSTEATRLITNRHALMIQHGALKNKAYTKNHGELILEADGVMVPTIAFKTSSENTDQRKNRICEWKEMRVGIIYPKGSRSTHYAASMTSPDDLGNQLLECAKQIGFDEKTKVHGMGDGALWIAEQVDRLFGAQSTFLIDFYHFSSYLSAAAQCVDPEGATAWFEHSKNLAKSGKIEEILNDLNAHITNNNHAQCPALTAYNYVTRRPNQFDYKSASDKGLPIGSGRAESTNKSLIQMRLKRAGAWWLPRNALAMVNLRILRIRGLWNDYWKQCQPEYRF